MKCPKCGMVVPDKDKVCEVCGADLTDPVLLATSAHEVKPKGPAAVPSPGTAPSAPPPPSASAPEAQAAAPPPPPPAAPLPEGQKACVGCNEAFPVEAMQLVAGRYYCPECQVKLIELAKAGSRAPDSVPPGMAPCSGCGHPKGPKQLKEIGGGLYCVNCEQKIVAAFRSGGQADFSSGVAQAAPGAAAPSAVEAASPGSPAGEPKRPVASDTSTALTPEEQAQREERKRTLEAERQKEREKEFARRIKSDLTRWPQVTLPPELEPPKDAEALRDRPAPPIPEMRFPNSGATRMIWGPIMAVLVALGAVLYLTGAGGTWGGFAPIFSGMGVLVCLYFFIDAFGGIRVDTKGIWRDSITAKKRIFWSSMRSVELIHQPMSGLAFLKGFYSRLDFVFTFTDGRKKELPIGTMMGKPCVRDFDGLKKHFKMGALANAVKVVERASPSDAGAPPPQ